jgi:hypothetical protein
VGGGVSVCRCVTPQATNSSCPVSWAWAPCSCCLLPSVGADPGCSSCVALYVACVDDDALWWGKIPGETYRLMVANTDHGFATGLPTLMPSFSGFVEGVLAAAAPPVFTWTIDPSSGYITILSKTQPSSVSGTFFVGDSANLDPWSLTLWCNPS